MSQRFLFLEEIDNSNNDTYTVTAHKGTFSLNNSKILFSVESSEGYQRNSRNDSYQSLAQHKVQDEAAKLTGNTDESGSQKTPPGNLTFKMKNDLKNGGLKIVTNKYTLLECTEDEAKLLHESTFTFKM